MFSLSHARRAAGTTALLAALCAAVAAPVALSGCSSEEGAGVAADADYATRLAAFVPKDKHESDLGNGWLAAGQPTKERLKEVLALKAVIISLRYKDEDPYDEAGVVKAAGGTFVRYPVKSEQYKDKAFREKLWDLYDEWQKKGELVFLHCKSSNRVGGSWAMYQFERKGLSAQEAYKLGEKAGMTGTSDIVKEVLGL